MANIKDKSSIISLYLSIVDENIDNSMLYQYTLPMNIEQALLATGLNEKEAKTYLAALQLGSATVNEIAKLSGIKRTTTYFILGSLVLKGVVSTKQTRTTTFYTAVKPARLAAQLLERQKTLEGVLPDLEKLYKSQLHKPHVEVFEGKEGVRHVYQEVAQFARKPREVLCFGSLEHFANTEYADMLEWWFELMRDKSHAARELLDPRDPSLSEYVSRIQDNANVSHVIRTAPKGYAFSHNDNLIYGTKVAIFSLVKEVFVVVIDSEVIANSYRSLFELAWKSGKKI